MFEPDKSFAHHALLIGTGAFLGASIATSTLLLNVGNIGDLVLSSANGDLYMAAMVIGSAKKAAMLGFVASTVAPQLRLTRVLTSIGNRPQLAYAE